MQYLATEQRSFIVIEEVRVAETPSGQEPYIVWFVRQFIDAEQDRGDQPDGMSDKDLYSAFILVIIFVSFILLTTGNTPLLH